MRKIIPIIISLMFSLQASPYIGVGSFDVEDDDLNIGGDIFSDFNEELEESKVMEDERFYRYGRFYSFNVSLGITTFAGNRGAAYENQHPSYGLSLNYFMDFETSFVLGFEYSKHHFYLDQATEGYYDLNNPDSNNGVGLVEVNLIRTFFAYRYYIDTANLGTAITYSNPYCTVRFEYWYMTNKFRDQSDWGNESSGAIGVGLGGGLEFPVKLKESYIGVELLWHQINFSDKYSQKYQPTKGSSFGYEDFTGDCYSAMVSYVMQW